MRSSTASTPRFTPVVAPSVAPHQNEVAPTTAPGFWGAFICTEVSLGTPARKSSTLPALPHAAAPMRRPTLKNLLSRCTMVFISRLPRLASGDVRRVGHTGPHRDESAGGDL